MKGEAVTLSLVLLSPFLSPDTVVVVDAAELHTLGLSLLEGKDGG